MCILEDEILIPMSKKESNPQPPDFRYRPAPPPAPPRYESMDTFNVKIINQDDYKKPDYLKTEDILTKSDDGTMVRLRSYNGDSWYYKTWKCDESEPDDWVTIIERKKRVV